MIPQIYHFQYDLYYDEYNTIYLINLYNIVSILSYHKKEFN